MVYNRLDRAIVGAKVSGVVAVLYQVRETIDDRGGYGETIGYFSNQTDAEAAAKGRGWYGGVADVREVYAVVRSGMSISAGDQTLAVILAEGATVTVDVDLVKQKKELTESAKKKLLATLTRQEMDALGIKV